MKLNIETGFIDDVIRSPSPNFDDRDNDGQPEVIIIHCISLPPGEYGTGAVVRFFNNELSADEHPYFKSMAHLRVSSHFLIERGGLLRQFVSTDKRAWHAGESLCLGRPKVNDFSIGIELEGLDIGDDGFTELQYETLSNLVKALQLAYPEIDNTRLFAHSDIAPGRKMDPGPHFDWDRLLSFS